MKFFAKKYIIGMVIAIVIIGGGTILFKNGNNGKEIITVTRENITQEVSVTGKTKAQNEVELGFDTNGRVARVFAVVGDKVNRGQIIAELDTVELLANLAKEKAVLAEEEEKLGEEGERIE
ncbi:MAG: biotin/lipoyl-binding protein, partial [Patescibacteria group bacterium]